jgi:glycosyltransferase involved in cell wall biosynthesis
MLSIVIPAYNAASTLGAQLASLEPQARDTDCEIIVADNGSADGTVATARRWSEHMPLRVVDASARRGPAAARNIGVAAAGGDVLLFVDADDIVLPGWLAAWVEVAPRLDAGGGPVVFFSGDHPHDSVRDGGPMELPTHMRFLPYALGANMAVRREVLDACGGFPEERRTAEDVALSWKAQLAGHELLFVRGALVAKRRAPSTRDTIRQYYRYGLSDPALYRQFRSAGVPAPAVGSALKSYGGLLARLPRLGDETQRQRWAAQLGRRTGRIVGSFRARAVYL